MLTWTRPAAAGRTNSRSQSLRSTDARRREELGDDLQHFGFPAPQTGEWQRLGGADSKRTKAGNWGKLVPGYQVFGQTLYVINCC